VLAASQESLNQDGCKILLDSKAPVASSPSQIPSPESKDYFVHESSYVDDGVEIGNGTKIWHFSHVLSGSRIGENCNIGQNVVIGPDVTIGTGCKIQNNISIYKGVTLEDEVFCGPSMVFTNVYNPRSAIEVFCGPSMVFTNVYNPRSAIRRMDELRPTLVKKGASIGANATVLCGITIGSFSFIGAGAVVLKDVPDYALVVGNPGKKKGWMCECGVKLNEYLVCPACDREYADLIGERCE
jgi:UDP-2-acetamido-3-amino-2,3-dideoxy-glucuronate N-acetyltransferase